MIKMEHDADPAPAMMAACLKPLTPYTELQQQQGAVHLHKKSSEVTSTGTNHAVLLVQTTRHLLSITKMRHVALAMHPPDAVARGKSAVKYEHTRQA
jgi:hypothetical protein